MAKKVTVLVEYEIETDATDEEITAFVRYGIGELGGCSLGNPLAYEDLQTCSPNIIEIKIA